MGYILLGHGGHYPQDITPPEMECVAIPLGTTIQYYSEAGQSLAYGSYELDRWDSLRAPWPPLDSSCVTLNMELQGAAEYWDEDLENHPELGGHQLIRPGVDDVPDPFVMCDGTPLTCPTRPDQVLVEGMDHQCDGILGRLRGELFWLACTTLFGVDHAVVQAALGSGPAGVVLGEDPDWVPGEAEHRAIDETNRAALADAVDLGMLEYVVGGTVLLIGHGHSAAFEHYALGDPGSVRGRLLVYEGGGVLGTGGLVFYDVPAGWGRLVRSAAARCSDKTIRLARD
ncbi:hypothetical protein ACFQ78_33525 [Streptomyces sp. NPDC056519]|uniref:hypothetical protein n=1 Tax=Streptomyces sp. NPDC056519 TaxID=3345849 RepID=UPI0036AC9257